MNSNDNIECGSGTFLFASSTIYCSRTRVGSNVSLWPMISKIRQQKKTSRTRKRYDAPCLECPSILCIVCADENMGEICKPQAHGAWDLRLLGISPRKIPICGKVLLSDKACNTNVPHTLLFDKNCDEYFEFRNGEIKKCKRIDSIHSFAHQSISFQHADQTKCQSGSTSTCCLFRSQYKY